MNKFYKTLIDLYSEQDLEVIVAKNIGHLGLTFILIWLLGEYEGKMLVVKTNYVFSVYALSYLISYIVLTFSNFYYIFHKKLKEENELNIIDFVALFILSLIQSIFFASAAQIDILVKNIVVKKILDFLTNPYFTSKILKINKFEKGE